MSSFIDRLLGRKPSSANQAKERLQLVLIYDRTDLTAEALQSLKDEIIQVISRYVEIDPADVNINMAQEGREQRLVADIPVKGARRRRAAG
jgi:cell division topological specificity factor